jgi:HAMP domain-containing protein
MKLYPKLVLTIFFLILLQSLVSSAIVSRSVRNENLRDARSILSRKAGLVAENYNSWKRHIWKQLILIREESLEYPQLNDELLEELLRTSRIDGILVRSPKTEHFLAVNPSEDFLPPSPKGLGIHYDHPAIQLFRLDGRLYLVGAMSLPRSESHEIYLIKHISGSFLDNIVLDPDGRVLIHTATDYLAGHRELQPLAFGEGRSESTRAYTEWHDLQNREGRWNMARAKVGWIDNERGTSDVYITILSSNEAFRERVRSIETTLLSVSMLTLILTILLSLVLTRSITRPVALLAGAMGRIREGEYDIRLKQKTGGELGILLQGFNDMASRLHMDQLKIEKSLEEITFLNEFNEEIIHTIRDALAVISESLEIEKHNFAFHSLNRTHSLDLATFLADSFEAPLLPVVRGVLRGDSERWFQRVRRREG